MLSSFDPKRRDAVLGVAWQTFLTHVDGVVTLKGSVH